MTPGTYINALRRTLAVALLKLDKETNAGLPPIEPGDWVVIETSKSAGSYRRVVVRYQVTTADVEQTR